jgi:hypothetical protein
VEEYRAKYEPHDELEVQPLGGPPAAGRRRDRGGRARPPTRPPNRFAIVVGALVALLIFLIVLGLTAGNDNGGSDQAAKNTNTERKRPAKRKRRHQAAKPTIVTLKVVPMGPTYVCLDKGPGTPHLFEGTISAPQTFKGSKLRINLGRTAGQLILNGKQFPVPPSATPVGYEFSTTGSKAIPPPERPCVAPTTTTTTPSP